MTQAGTNRDVGSSCTSALSSEMRAHSIGRDKGSIWRSKQRESSREMGHDERLTVVGGGRQDVVQALLLMRYGCSCGGLLLTRVVG